jgi:hypothetical protein
MTLSVAGVYGTGWEDDNLERIWKEAVVAQSKYHIGILLERLR